jgi:hypothetical protein
VFQKLLGAVVRYANLHVNVSPAFNSTRVLIDDDVVTCSIILPITIPAKSISGPEATGLSFTYMPTTPVEL